MEWTVLFLSFLYPFGGGSGTGNGGYRACTPSQLYCNLQCPGGYVKGPGGCDFCMCNQHGPTRAITSTTSSSTSYMSSTKPVTSFSTKTTTATATTSVSNKPTSTSSVICANIAEECRIRCGDHGYLVDPADCSYCVCKKSNV